MCSKPIKAASMLICVLMLFSATACQSQGSAIVSSPSTSSVAAKAEPMGKYTPEITVSTVRVLSSTTKFDTQNPDRASLQQNIWQKAYKDQLGINWDYLWTPNQDQYDQKWNVAIASGDIPDMAEVDATVYKALVQGNLVEDMTDIYKQYASDYYKKANTEDNGATMKYMTFDGKLLGLPINGSQPDNVNLLFIRKDWLKKVNMTEPKTMDDLVKVAQAFKDAKLGGKDTIGLAISKNTTPGMNDGQNNFGGFFNGYGAFYGQWNKDSSGNLAYGTIQPEMKPALLKLQQMYKAGLVAPDFAVKDSNKAGQDVVAGKCGMTYGTYWAPLGTIKDAMVADKNSDWECIEAPTADGSPYKTQGSSAPTNYLFVKKGCAHPEAAVKAINLSLKLKTDDYDHYCGASDGVEVFKYSFCDDIFMPWKNLDDWKADAEAIKTGDTSKLSPSATANYNFIKAGQAGDRANLAYDLVFGLNGTYKYINDLKDSNRIVVEAYQSLPTDTQVTKGNDLNTTLDAAIMKVIMGDDISTFDKAVAAWKTGGGDQITKEVNDWYSKNK